MQLAHNSKKPKFFWAPSEFNVGAAVSTGTKQTSMQECNDEISPMTGATLVEQAHKKLQDNATQRLICQPM